VPVFAVSLSELLSVVWVSLGSTVVVTVLFSLVVRESGRAGEARRAGDAGRAGVHVALAVLLFVAFAAFVAYGVVIMLSKD
jgi:uncharacterized membrane protein YhaH (DUF805 family)